jgi:hypothetical protein
LQLFGWRPEWPLDSILERMQYLAEIQNPWYDNRHRSEEAWRWRGLLVAAERRLYTTGDKRSGNFLFESSVTH